MRTKKQLFLKGPIWSRTCAASCKNHRSNHESFLLNLALEQARVVAEETVGVEQFPVCLGLWVTAGTLSIHRSIESK
jgi:hypothetical protein